MKFIVNSGYLLAHINDLKIEQSGILKVLEEFLFELRGVNNLEDIDLDAINHKKESTIAQFKSNQALLKNLLRTLKLSIILIDFRDFAILRNRFLTKILNAFSGSEAEGNAAQINSQFYYSFKNHLKCLKNIQFQNYQLL